MNEGLMGVIIGVGGIIVAIISVAVAYMAFKHGRNKDENTDLKEESIQDATFKSDIEYIKRRSDDTLLEIRDMRKCMSDHDQRLTRCEESTKSAHHRIDEIKAKMV